MAYSELYVVLSDPEQEEDVARDLLKGDDPNRHVREPEGERRVAQLSGGLRLLLQAELNEGLSLGGGEPAPEPTWLERLDARVVEEREGGPFPVGAESVLELRGAFVVRE